MCPSRTTRSMLRKRSSSHWASVGAFAIVGVIERSMRSMTPAASESEEEIVRGGGRDRRLHGVGSHPGEHRGIGLNDRAVEHPRLPRANPADRVRVDPAFQQPDTGVGCRLPGSDDHELRRWGLQPQQLVDRHRADPVGDAERRRGGRGNLRGDIAGVDDPALRPGLEALPGQAGGERAVTHVLAVGVELHPARWHQSGVEHLLVVRTYLRSAGPLVQTGLGALTLDRPGAQDPRGNAIEEAWCSRTNGYASNQ